MRNEILESEVRRIMEKTNQNHYQWTSKQDAYYFDQNTLFVILNQFFDDGVNEKRYSLLLMLTPAGMKTVSTALYYKEADNFECFDSFFTRILNVEKHENVFKIRVKMASGLKKSLEC